MSAREIGKGGARTLRIGIDTGGTFTDIVVVDGVTGERRTAKVPSTPQRPSSAVFEALDRAGIDASDVEFLVLGTTIATNCLIERKGQRTVYITTAGFEDVPFIQRIDRKSLYDLQWLKPLPYVERRDCIGVRERVDHTGAVRVPLEDAEIARLVTELGELHESTEGGIAIAINLLFSFVHPEHERRLADAIRRALPGVPMSASHEVAPIWREYERASTVITDAYLRRLTGAFAEEVDQGLEERGLTTMRALLKSNGGQVAMARAPRRPVDFILSGLAGGLIGAQHFAESVGRTNILTLDMGGTSADVGVVVEGAIRNSSSYEFEWGLPIAIPVIDLSTIGAGGSSIAGFDQGGLLKVGPESAGADPGPAAYGRGAEWATVTDANVVLGRLNPAYFLGGDLPLDAERARAAVGRIAATLGTDIEHAAQAIVDITCENMASAIRLLCADRGLDYRRFELMAFGGAGPLHGAPLMRRLGLPGMVVPPNPGLTSAFGAQAADLRVDRRLTRLLRSDLATAGELRASVAQISRQTLDELLEDGATRPLLTLSVSCRYRGQNFEQDVAIPNDPGEDILEILARRFHDTHEAAYGYRLEGAVIEFVHINATAREVRTTPSPLPLPVRPAIEPVDVRRVFFGKSGWVETPIYRRSDLGASSVFVGPAIVEEIDSTTIVLESQSVSVHASGTLLLAETNGRKAQGAEERDGLLV